jgi:hypothetical protein
VRFGVRCLGFGVWVLMFLGFEVGVCVLKSRF